MHIKVANNIKSACRAVGITLGSPCGESRSDVYTAVYGNIEGEIADWYDTMFFRVPNDRYGDGSTLGRDPYVCLLMVNKRTIPIKVKLLLTELIY